jgi:phage terminase large subunit-like protein
MSRISRLARQSPVLLSASAAVLLAAPQPLAAGPLAVGVDTPPTRTDITRVIQSWDTAMKGEQIHDFSVCTIWLTHKGNHYLLDVVRRQHGYPALLELCDRPVSPTRSNGLLMEDKASGTALI